MDELGINEGRVGWGPLGKRQDQLWQDDERTRDTFPLWMSLTLGSDREKFIRFDSVGRS